jgi:hypothetical protein
VAPALQAALQRLTRGLRTLPASASAGAAVWAPLPAPAASARPVAPAPSAAPAAPDHGGPAATSLAAGVVAAVGAFLLLHRRRRPHEGPAGRPATG